VDRIDTLRSSSLRNRTIIVRDPKTKQELRVTCTDDDDVAVYTLDEGEPGPDGVGTPEAVLVGTSRAQSFVLFVELTQSFKPRAHRRKPVPVDPAPRKMKQLQDAIDHFHPRGKAGGARCHGDEHHDAWQRGDDLPYADVSHDHWVGGIAIGYDHEARSLPPPHVVMNGKLVKLAIWSPVPSTRGKGEVRLKDLFRNLGWVR
jgi:hypothetical protein